VIFDGTIKFNLDPEKKHKPEYLIKMMHEAGLQELLKREPNSKHVDDPDLDIEAEDFGTGEGLDFKIDPESLSAGEKQLFCILRAILRENKIVVLDEATANIDIVTEKKINNLMQQHFKNSTVFTIAHRINTIIDSDNVMVMDKGRCLEFGNPKKLSQDSKSEFY
jgi:ABC-type multidrug transport system fused ATPase/permease subunit